MAIFSINCKNRLAAEGFVQSRNTARGVQGSNCFLKFYFAPLQVISIECHFEQNFMHFGLKYITLLPPNFSSPPKFFLAPPQKLHFGYVPGSEMSSMMHFKRAAVIQHIGCWKLCELWHRRMLAFGSSPSFSKILDMV